MSYRQLGRRMNTLVNSCGPFCIRRLPDERSYVIRDVLAFADPSERRPLCNWQSYYEPISYLEFDRA